MAKPKAAMRSGIIGRAAPRQTELTLGLAKSIKQSGHLRGDIKLKIDPATGLFDIITDGKSSTGYVFTEKIGLNTANYNTYKNMSLNTPTRGRGKRIDNGYRQAAESLAKLERAIERYDDTAKISDELHIKTLEIIRKYQP